MTRKKRSKDSQRSKSPLQFEQLEPRQLLAADLAVEWMPITSPLLGETMDVSLGVSNIGTETGFGPFVDMVVPGDGEVGDGLRYVRGSGSLLGTNVKETVIVFGVDGLATHPFAVDASGENLIIEGAPNDQLVVFELPFGSYTESQPSVQVDFQIVVGSFAAPQAEFELVAAGGFRYGHDPLDNAGEDPMLIGSGTPNVVSPEFVRTEIKYLGPENETATGQNFVRSYRVSLDIVEDSDVEDLKIVVQLSDNEVYMGISESSWEGQSLRVVSEPVIGQVGLDQELMLEATSLVGIAGVDSSFILDVLVPREDAFGELVIDPITATESVSTISTYAVGTWIREEASGTDPADLVEFESAPAIHELQDKLLAVQQSVFVSDDRNSVTLGPGDTLQYAIDFQVSDYAILDDLLFVFSIPDGQEFATTESGQLTMFGVGDERGGREFQISFSVHESSTPGQQSFVADVAELLRNLGLDSQLAGGHTENGFGSAVFGTINYQTVVNDLFLGEVPSGDVSIDEGDLFESEVYGTASTVDPATKVRTGFEATDDSRTRRQVKVSSVETSVFAVNGDTDFPNVDVSAGDLVTFRITREVSSGDIEDLVLSEFLPLPVFSLDSLEWSDLSSNDLTANQIQLGPSDDLHEWFDVRPEIMIDSGNNSFTLDYGDLDWTENQTLKIDILVSLRVQDQAFADGLWLSSMAVSRQGSSNNGDFGSGAIADIRYTRPVVTISKSAVGSSNEAARLVDSSNGTDIKGVDAGDLVDFELVIENVGASANGAHNTMILDFLPAGFVIPESGINLRVVDANGDQLDYVWFEPNPDGGLFENGIELVNPIASSQNGNPAGRVFIQYQLKVAEQINPNVTTSSDAKIVHYAAVEDGENYVTSVIEDAASVTSSHVSVVHSVVSSDQQHTANRNVVVGETVTYKAVVNIPEGAQKNGFFEITAPRGMTFNELISVAYSDAIQIAGQDEESLAANAVILDHGQSIRNGGRILRIPIGDLVNENRDNGTDEYFEVVYTATVTNDPGNDAGDSRRNLATWSHSSGNSSDASSSIKIHEPSLAIEKSWSADFADAGDQVQIRLEIVPGQTKGATAFDVLLNELIPAGTTYVANSIQWLSGAIPYDTSVVGNEINVRWESISVEQTTVLTFQVVVDHDVHAGTDLASESKISWSSLPGIPGQIAEANELSFERTGDSQNAGGLANDYVTLDETDLTVSPVKITMELIETSQNHTLNNELTIGEWAEYEVVMTVPEGIHDITINSFMVPNLAVFELESLTVISIGGNLNTENVEIGSRVDVDENGRINLSFGLVENVVDNVLNDQDQIVFRLIAAIPEVGQNQAGETAEIAFVADFQHGEATVFATVDVVEPSLEITQMVSNRNVDATETVEISVLIEHSQVSSSGAISLAFIETLSNAGMRLIPGSVVVEGGQVLVGNGDRDLQIEVVADFIPESGFLRVTYQAKVAEDVSPGTILTLSPRVTYASISDSSGRRYDSSVSTNIQVNETIITGIVFVDANQDGVVQFGDHGIGGTDIKLLGTDHLGNVVTLQVATAATGTFRFDGLRPGDYRLVASQSNDYFDGADYAGTIGVAQQDRVSDIVIETGHTGTLSNYRFTVSPLTWIEGTVFVDENQDGQLGQDENGIGGVQIELTGINSLGEVVERNVLTNYRGYFVFEYLEPGTYELSQGFVPGFLDASEQMGSNGGTVANDFFGEITVDAKSPGKMYNFGEYAPASLSGQVYVDYDRDSVLDRKDGLVAGVDVFLEGLDDLGQEVWSAVSTDIDGNYIFEDLRPGNYRIVSELLEGLDFSISNVGLFLGDPSTTVDNGIGIEYGFEQISLSAGNWGQAYNLGHVDPQYWRSKTANEFVSQTLIHGSNTDDQFLVSFSGDGAVVSVNGTEYEFDSLKTRSLRLLGSFGQDSLQFTGSENKEIVELRRNSARITGTWFESLVYGMETVHFIGGGNEDLARIYDTSGNDQLAAGPFTATLTGNGYKNSVEGIHRVYTYMTEGFDTVSFVGQAGSRDNFKATPDNARLYGSQFYLWAEGFDVAEAIATDVIDRAYLFGSDNADQLTTDGNLATLQGDGYRVVARGFDYAAVSAGLGDDSAVLTGSTGDDRLRSRPSKAIFDLPESRIIAKDFEQVRVLANGGQDKAHVHDSQFDDLFEANSENAIISNQVNVTTMIGFDRVYSYMDAGGTDVAVVDGAGGSNIFKASPKTWSIESTGAYFFGSGFTTVTASGDSNDKAYLYDSSSNDTLQLSENSATLSGQRFANSVHGFGKVNSEASDGNDRVIFTDSSTHSTIRMNEQKASFFGSGFSHNATGFDAVDAYFIDLDGRDNVDIEGRIGYDLIALDASFANFKLSLFFDSDHENVDFRSSVDRLL